MDLDINRYLWTCVYLWTWIGLGCPFTKNSLAYFSRDSGSDSNAKGSGI